MHPVERPLVQARFWPPRAHAPVPKITDDGEGEHQDRAAEIQEEREETAHTRTAGPEPSDDPRELARPVALDEVGGGFRVGDRAARAHHGGSGYLGARPGTPGEAVATLPPSVRTSHAGLNVSGPIV